MIADVTGSAAVYGTMQKNAYELANDDVKSGIIDAGGANLSFDVEDAASDGAQVVNLMQKFTTDGTTPLVLGPTLSGEAFRAFPIAKAANFPVMGTSTTAEGVTAIGPTVFRDSLAESQAFRRPWPKCNRSGMPRRWRSSTGMTTRSPRPTAICSRVSFRRTARRSSTPRRFISAIRISVRR